MLQRVSMHGIKLPRLYIAETKEDAQLAADNGLPYVRWRWGNDELVKVLLRPVLEKMFPGISWNKVLGRRRKVNSVIVTVRGDAPEDEEHPEDLELDKAEDHTAHEAEPGVLDIIDHDGDEDCERVVEIADGKRTCSGKAWSGYDTVSIEDYVGDLSSSVNIEIVQELGLLPKFVGDVTDCIKLNLANRMRWTEGFNKKRGAAIGKFESRGQLPNLIIIDISWSIPDGIAATMLALADTLRSQCGAELIITSARSGWYPTGAELPSPQELRQIYGRSNEGYEFMGILNDRIAGREFGHVISFGDWDNPGNFGSYNVNLADTKVHEIWHYHTRFLNAQTGYAEWAESCNPDEIHYDNTWCNVMNNRYSM